MVNELTSATSPNQIFWIYFLVHLRNWRSCKIHVLCQPVKSSGTWASDSRRASCCTAADPPLATLSCTSIRGISLACQVCEELVGAVSVATVSARGMLVMQPIPCWNSWGGGAPALEGCSSAHTQHERLFERAQVWGITGSIKLELA